MARSDDSCASHLSLSACLKHQPRAEPPYIVISNFNILNTQQLRARPTYMSRGAGCASYRNLGACWE
jgi:hypothetical protein